MCQCHRPGEEEGEDDLDRDWRHFVADKKYRDQVYRGSLPKQIICLCIALEENKKRQSEDLSCSLYSLYPS